MTFKDICIQLYHLLRNLQVVKFKTEFDGTICTVAVAFGFCRLRLGLETIA